MFTGLIEATVTIVRTAGERHPGGTTPLRLEIENPWGQEAGTQGGKASPAAGDSVAVDGVCLTVVAEAASKAGAPAATTLAFDVAHETLERTTLGGLQPGRRIHLERALAFGDRLGGHLVSGHVDAVGVVGGREMRGSSLYLGIDVAPSVANLSAAQGSITLAGVSLTIASMEGARVWVCLIPHTLSVTHLGDLQLGDRINCEADLLARYLQRLVAQHPLAPAHAAATPATSATSAPSKSSALRKPSAPAGTPHAL